MTRKEWLVDLEYAVPKEDRIAAVRAASFEEEISEDLGESFSDTQDVCSCCGRSSEQGILLAVLSRNENRWVCIRCLKNLMGMRQDVPHSIAHEVNSSSRAEGATTMLSNSSNPMSMFD